MISRRNVLKTASTGFILALLGGTAHRTFAQSGHGSVPMLGVSASPNGHMPGPAPSIEAPVAIKWRFHHTGVTTGSVIVAEDTVFLASDDGFLYAIDSATGSERWRFSIGIGSQITPAYAHGMVFTPSSGNIFYALDAASGEIVWQFTAPEWEGMGDEPFTTFWDFMHVSTIENLVLVQSAITGLHAFDASTGHEQWNISHAGYPKVADDTLITDFVSISGYDRNTMTQTWDLDDNRSRSVLAVADGHVAVWLGAPGSGGGFAPGSTLEVIDPQTGIRKWVLEDHPHYLRSGVIAQDLVIVEFVGAFEPDEEELIAFDLATGEEVWRVDFSGATILLNAPMMAIEDTLYRLRGDSHLVAYDIATGNELWALPVSAPQNLGRSQVAVVDGVLFVSGDDGVLYALANPEPAVLIQDVTLRGAPSSTGVERGTAAAGTEFINVGARNDSAGQEWVEVTIEDATGWIPLEAIDPATLAPEGEVEYVYVP